MKLHRFSGIKDARRWTQGWLIACAAAICPFAAQAAQATGRIEKPLVIVTNAPPVQMLVPGFTGRELPLEVNNINNLVYAPDGRLFALCYDGNVLQLKDSNGDGQEDTATYFYRNDKNEIQPSIGMCWGPGGLYIASQGRVIRLRDRGDGTADLETVTSGWPKPTSAAGSNLDAVGIAVDKTGNIFFGLGCDAWNYAYRVNKKTDKSDYDIHSERGTILKLSPDGKTREIVSTGVRFTVSLAFNAEGDLFCSEQEGATWLANGNPFDELLHVQQGRHYGFPPRHPKYLPNAIDEPSTFDYSPQHQSTCGLHFDEPVAGGTSTFGPSWWRGDALLSGESRGKIWRTKLVKTAAGYVARTDLIACLSMLTIDAAPTPQGDLLVACHSGQPDWGTGPSGKGKLFKISYTGKTTPQPVLAFATSPTETEIVFDRALDAKDLDKVAKSSAMAMGLYVSAGERYETFRPGYQAVKNQRTMPRFELPVASARLSKDKHALILQTAARSEAVNYAVTIPGSVAKSAGEIDVLSDLTGVEAQWKASSGKQSWSGWLPHLELTVARGFTAPSAAHQAFFKHAKEPGTLTLKTQLDLWQMLHPAIQPGAKLDFEYPPETVTVVLKSDGKLDLKTTGNVTRVSDHEVRVTTGSHQNDWLPLEVTLATGTGGGEPQLEANWFTAEDSRLRPLPLRRVLLPWAKPYGIVTAEANTPEIAGGDWERGRNLFFGETVSCFKCHQMRGEGGNIGPDLSNLIYRDYTSVMRDITEPSAAINPEHIGYNVELKDGDVQSGVLLKNDRDEVVLGQSSGKPLSIPKGKVAGMKVSSISIMPEGLLKALDAQQQKDLMTFLLTMPKDKK